MKVLAIRGKNIASLEGEFAIDFMAEPLLSAGIFAISGPTGAGKSTLLDVLCLALFAKTPRTEQAKKSNVKVRDINEESLMQSDPRFLLRRGTASGYAEADFLALNGHRYRARWAIARAREKESGRLQNARISLVNIDTGAEEPGKNTEIQMRIAELIGLTFDQFTRSVLLAQNDFSTFLRAEHDEKAQLLEKLTGTEQYSAISRLIYEKTADAKEAYDKVRIRMEGLELLSEEDEEALRQAFEAIEKTSAQLEKQKKEQEALQEAVKNTEKAVASRQTQQKEAEKQLTKASALVESSRKEYEKAKEELWLAEEQYAKIKPELQAARKLDTQLEAEKQSLKETETAWKKTEKEQLEGEDRLKKLITRQQEGKKELDKLVAWRSKYQSKEKIAGQLSALLLHLDCAATARKAKEKAGKSIAGLKQQIVLLDRQIKEIRISANLPEDKDITQTIASCRNKREDLLLEQARFVTEGNVKTLRNKLSEGIPCPVCGSTEHPYTNPQVHEHQEKLKQETTALTLRLKQLDTLFELVSRRKQPAEQLPREENEFTAQTDILDHSLQAANELFGNDEWQPNWLQDPEKFRRSLTAFAEEWQTNKEQLEIVEQQQNVWKSEQQTVEHFLVSLCKQTELAKEAFTNRQNVLQKLQAERSALLLGTSADQTEKAHTRQLEDLKSRLDKLLQIQTEQSGIAGQLKGVTEQIGKELAKANEDLILHRKAFDEWTAAYQSSREEAVSLDKELADVRQQKTELSFRLRKQEENKKKMLSLKEELDSKRTINERWGKLNDLAGSADGAKFRRIAQGYTLDVLLNYANVQLRHLTNRYSLERVPGTLALQVIDCDMCDEIRTVHSLSGGESFLVSLALALGLSSLSSNRMKVESLFIDEGFGSLDAETLRIAIDALENLRTQGRKIGVISHIQEMTERIPTQIKVNRAGNGRSFLEIY